MDNQTAHDYLINQAMIQGIAQGKVEGKAKGIEKGREEGYCSGRLHEILLINMTAVL